MSERRINEAVMTLASTRAPTLVRLSIGVVLGLAILAIHVGLDRMWPGGARFALIMPAVLISCLAFGRAAGTTTLATGVLGVWWLIMPSRGKLTALSPGEIFTLSIFIVAGALTILIAEAYRSISRDLVRELDTKDLLVKELNHRVKNSLATVQSLAAQSLSRLDDPKGARAAFEGQLLALSRAHDVLTATSWSHAGLFQILEGAIAPFGPERFTWEGEDFTMSPQKALAVAMALHELATNAVKYGALSTSDGQVEIVTGVDARQRYLSWREHGGPPVAPRTHKGFGSRLLERALAQDIDGKIVLEFPPEGVRCRLMGL